MLNLVFDKTTGSIVSLRDAHNDYLCSKHERYPLFRIRLLTPGRQFQKTDALMARMVNMTDTDSVTEITFLDFADTPGLTVIAKISQISAEEIHWDLKVDNETDNWVESIEYPCMAFRNLMLQERQGMRLFFPRNEGLEIFRKVYRKRGKHPVSKDACMYPGMVTMQFVSLHTDTYGLYYAAHDTEVTPKIIDYFIAEDSSEGFFICFDVYHSIAPHSEKQIGYPMVLQTHSGTWYGAAEIYRKFLENSDFPLPEKISNDGKLPEWYHSSPVVIVNGARGRRSSQITGEHSDELTDSISELDMLSERFDTPIMSLLTDWEGSAPWAPPFNWPPFNGETAFKEYIRKMHERRYIVGIYGSGLNWTDSMRKSDPEHTFDMRPYRAQHGLDKVFSRYQDGTPVETACADIRTGAHFCPACGITEEISINEIAKAAEAGVDYYQYLDQDNGGFGAPCYSTGHPHPPVFGSWMPSALYTLYHKFYSYSRSCLLGTEAVSADYFASVLRINDLRNHWNIYAGTPVPAIEFCLHEYMINFMGNQCNYEKIAAFEYNPESFLLRLAYAFVTGDLMTVSMRKGGKLALGWNGFYIQLIPEENAEDIYKCIRNYSALRRGIAKAYLQYGRMLAPDPVIVDMYKLQLTKQIRNTHLDGSFDLSYELTGDVRLFPNVEYTKWQAPDGSKAMVFANFSHDCKTVAVKSDIQSIATHINYISFTNENGYVSFVIPPFTAACALISN